MVKGNVACTYVFIYTKKFFLERIPARFFLELQYSLDMSARREFPSHISLFSTALIKTNLDREEVLDITLCGESLFDMVESWRAPYEHSFSDRRYIEIVCIA